MVFSGCNGSSAKKIYPLQGVTRRYKTVKGHLQTLTSNLNLLDFSPAVWVLPAAPISRQFANFEL
jgi:hypothetical protein